jgi:hypothetical protein
LLKQLNEEVSSLKTDIEAKKAQIEKIEKGSSESTELLKKLEIEKSALEQKLNEKDEDLLALEENFGCAEQLVETLKKSLESERANFSRIEERVAGFPRLPPNGESWWWPFS